MGKLNDGAKFAFSSFNTFLLLVAAVFTGAASYAIYSTTGGGYRSAAAWLAYLLVVGVALLVASLLGCAGVQRQIVRRGRCTGRCLLFFYQLAMLGFLAVFGAALLSMRALDSNVAVIKQNPTAEYHKIERTALASVFDRFYFKTYAAAQSGQGGYGWFTSWVDTNCPASMDYNLCQLCGSGGTYDPQACCPDEDLCASGRTDACPYMRCRRGVATYLGVQLGLFQRYLYVLMVLLLVVLLNTCLLICYNPRDSLAELLAKTGVLVMHDIDGQAQPALPTSAAPRPTSRRRSPRYSPRQEHGYVASPTNYNSNNSPSGGGGGGGHGSRSFGRGGGGGGAGGGGNTSLRRSPHAAAQAVPVAVTSPVPPMSVDGRTMDYSHPHAMV